MVDSRRAAQRGAQEAGRSETARKVVRIGWAAKGVVYVALAWIVLQSAFGSAPEQATTTGALQLIAGTAPGSIALVVLGLGLIAYAVGRVLEVTTLAGPQIDGKDKAEAFVLAVVYLALAVTAFSIVGLVSGSSGSSGSGGSTGSQQGSAFLLGLPGGQVLVGLVGVALVGFGAYEAWKGVQKRFMPTLRTAEMSAQLRSATERIGTAAYVTKGVLFALIGYSFLQAALTYDPNAAKGLDAVLAEIAQSTFGRIVLPLVALGLLAYGVLAFIESRYRRIGSSATGTA